MGNAINADNQRHYYLCFQFASIYFSYDMHNSMISWYDWLYTPRTRNDGKPRALRLSSSFPNAKDPIEQIKKVY
jgi:hypothetical protein